MLRNRCATLLVPLLAAVCSMIDPRTFSVHGADCSDKQPSGFPCEMEKIWGKCSEPWMKDGGFCESTCGFCPVNGSASKGKAEEESDKKPKRPKRSRAKATSAPAPAPSDGDLIKVGDTSFEVEAPKTIEGSGTRSFNGFDLKCKTIIETLAEIPDASIASRLASSLKEGDEELYDQLDDKDTQFTFFVPLDTAFEPFLESLEDPDDLDVVAEIIKRHLLEEVTPTSAMEKRAKLPTVAKGSIVVEKSTAAGVSVSRGSAQADIVLENAWACHSMIHLVDDVLVAAE